MSQQPELVSTLKLEKNGHCFVDNILECIFLKEKYGILIKISLKFISRGSIDNKLSSNKPLSESMLSNTYFTKWHHQATIG